MFRTEGFQKYLKNFSWLFADRVLRLVLILVTTIFVTRYLGAEQIGQLNYALAIVSIAMVISSMGANEVIARDLVRHPERQDELMGSAFMIKLVGGIVLNIVVFLFAVIDEVDPYMLLLIMVTASGELFRWSTVIEYFFLSRVQGRISAQVNIFGAVLGAAYKLLLVYWEAPLIWFAWAYLLELVVYAVVSYLAYRMQGYHVRNWKPSWRMARYLLNQSWPMLIYGFALQAQLKIDQVMIFDILKGPIGEQAANVEVGQYSVAVKMVEAMAFLPVILQLALAPAIARARMQDVTLYRQRVTNQYRLMFILYVFTSLPLYFLAEPLITWLYGEEFRVAGQLLAVFAVRLVFSYIGIAKGSFITNEGLFKFSLITAVIGAVINIVLNWLLIPTLRSDGAIWATLISFFVSVYLADLFTARTRVNFRMMTEGMFTFWKIGSVK